MTEPTITQDDEQLAWQILDALNPISCCEMTIDEAKIAVRIVREAAVAELRAEVELVRGIAREAVLALSQHTSYGCPACPGDCASANPPVMVCPTQAALNAFAMWDAYQKETSHDD